MLTGISASHISENTFSMPRSTNTLTVANISKRFGDIEAVRDVTFAVQPGEIVGFVGPNGAGKTTTISMLMGYLRPDRGTVHILGQKITPDSAHKVHRAIGFIAGDMVLPNALTGTQFLNFIAKQNGRDHEQYAQLLSQLSPVLNRPIHLLSRGNKQKIALIAALQHKPSILIFDEPTSGLDPLMQDVFLRAISQEASRGATVLMSSHILSEVSTICSRIVFMKAGKCILDQSIEAITGKLGKHVVVTTPDVTKLKQFLPSSVSLISHTQTQLRLLVATDELKNFLRWITSKNFTDITIEERELDDIFHELYIDTKGKKK